MESLSHYPHWFVLGCEAVAVAVLLWVVLKLVKAVLWVMIFGVLIIGGAAAVWLLLR